MQFAFNCAQSILIYNDIRIFIISNMDFTIPDKFKKNIFIMPAKKEHIPLGIGMKLYMDEYLQTEHTLFIDSDCICFGNLDEVFEACQDMDVTVVGNVALTEEWCGEECAALVKKNHNMNEIIRFNGGLYYIKKTPLANEIFSKARALAKEFSYGFDIIKNKWVTEELAISIAMQLYHQRPIPDNGYFMTDLYTDRRPNKINVLKGERSLNNPLYPLPLHRPWYPERYSPIVLHFGGKNINAYPYLSQRLLLKLDKLNLPMPVTNMLINIFVHLPYKSYHWIKRYIKPH